MPGFVRQLDRFMHLVIYGRGTAGANPTGLGIYHLMCGSIARNDCAKCKYGDVEHGGLLFGAGPMLIALTGPPSRWVFS